MVGKQTNKMIISTTFRTIFPLTKFWHIISVLFSLSFEINAPPRTSAAKVEMFLNKHCSAYWRIHGGTGCPKKIPAFDQQ